MTKPWAIIQATGLWAILFVIVGFLCLLAILGIFSPIAWNAGVYGDFAEGHWNLYEQRATWGPWEMATSCPWEGGPRDWRPATVRHGQVLFNACEVTFWQEEGKPTDIGSIRCQARLGWFLFAGAVVAVMGTLLSILWYRALACVGEDRMTVARTRANACFVVLHCAVVVLGFVGIASVWPVDPRRDERLWLIWTYVGGFQVAGLLANAAVGYWALLRRRQSAALTAAGVLSLLSLPLATLWVGWWQ